jgi:hypothetical protein
MGAEGAREARGAGSDELGDPGFQARNRGGARPSSPGGWGRWWSEPRRFPLPQLLAATATLAALLTACWDEPANTISRSVLQPEIAAPPPGAPVTFQVARLLHEVDETWIVDPAHHLHGDAVDLSIEWLPNGDFTAELHAKRPNHYGVRLYFLQVEGGLPRVEAEMWWEVAQRPDFSGRAETVRGHVVVTTADWSPGARVECEFGLHAESSGQPVSVRGAFVATR